MKLRHLSVQNFRGIRSLDWKISGDVVCLVGPGDSTKSTILDAIEYVLYPRWNLTFYDIDFYNAEVDKPIEITATISGMPQKLIRDDKFGLHLHFWNYEDGLHDEQKDEDEYALVISLRVGSSLEPEWCVTSGQTGEAIKISAADRELLGVSRIGNYLDRDLSWGRGSALSRLTGRDNADEMPMILAEASRNARESVQSANLQHLSDAASRVEKSAFHFGVSPRKSFQPGMDPFSVSVSLGALTLIDDNIPLRSLGLGSRRLVAMSIHKDSSKDGAILLIDEIEQGLEPYRLRSLIRTLRPAEDENGSSTINRGYEAHFTMSAFSSAERLPR